MVTNWDGLDAKAFAGIYNSNWVCSGGKRQGRNQRSKTEERRGTRGERRETGEEPEAIDVRQERNQRRET